jgi:S1-C subfamily serine protease
MLDSSTVFFCIQCGAQNQENAIFCITCGQVLYRDQKVSVSKGARKWWPPSVFFFSSLAIVLLILTFLVARLPKQTVQIPVVPSDAVSKVNKPAFSKAVLTIVGIDRHGSAVSQGSGFILSPDGVGGSNYHVLKGASKAVAECCGGRTFEIVSVEGADLIKDLVVFQLRDIGETAKPKNLDPLALGSSRDISIGEKVLVIGSPQGLENTVSDGIVSAIREYKSVRYLQITAPISAGSSGGPVLNENGHVVGIATFQFERGQNLNFAVAAEHLRPLLDQHLGLSLFDFQAVLTQAQGRRQATSVREQGRETPVKVPEADNFTGQFGGIVHNQSAGLSAEFGLIVREDSGSLSGCMGVKQPLFGSGPLSGISARSDVSFVVKSAVGTITFTGHRSGDSVMGTYTVEHENRPRESGTFSLRKLKSEGLARDFDRATCPTDAEMGR